ncbi:MAG: hypothetical protein IPJ34_09080 [Myxococcales bacterium]|nr:hypothetical protein [Myxococcales bacterium]
MRTRVTLQLLQEIDRFDLRWTCDDCVHLGEGPTGAFCNHGWPGLSRRGASPLRPGDALVFCKEFEGY